MHPKEQSRDGLLLELQKQKQAFLAIKAEHVKTITALRQMEEAQRKNEESYRLNEQRLKHSHELMRYIIEHNRSAVAVHDKNLHYIYVSQRYLDEYQIKDQDIIGKHHYDVFPDLPQKWRDIHQKALRGEVSSAEDDPYFREDGTVEWTRWECRPWYEQDDSIGGIIIYTEVITKRKQVEEEIRRLNENLEQIVKDRTARLEASNKELEAFSYTISHDLRAPLRHISGYAALLNSRFSQELPDKAKHYLNTLSEASKQMAQLIDDLLQFSRTGRQELKADRTDMEALVNEVIDKLKNDCEGRNIDWIIESLPMVQADYALIRQVWFNLLDNAVKYTKNKANAKIEIGCINEPENFVFFVRDNGTGFDMKHVDKIFGVFQRLHSQDAFDGTGIGLANVQQIIHKHGGRVWAESEPDKGATFYFSLPKSGEN